MKSCQYLSLQDLYESIAKIKILGGFSLSHLSVIRDFSLLTSLAPPTIRGRQGRHFFMVENKEEFFRRDGNGLAGLMTNDQSPIL